MTNCSQRTQNGEIGGEQLLSCGWGKLSYTPVRVRIFTATWQNKIGAPEIYWLRKFLAQASPFWKMAIYGEYLIKLLQIH